MTSNFHVHDTVGYEQLMGRWSQRLAPLLIDFAGLADNEKILDVGCGTGSLTFALAKNAKLREIDAIDYSPVFIEEVIRRNIDTRIKVRQADACALPFGDSTFDRALALLVLHFIPDASIAVGEMRRVVRSGGVVAAAVWDHMGGMPGMRMLVDTAAALSESGILLRNHFCFQTMTQPGELKQAFVEQGLVEVTETQLMIRLEYQNFDDFWAPLAAGEGPLGKYLTALNADERLRIDTAVRRAYESGRADGPRSFANVAWACRGIVPD